METEVREEESIRRIAMTILLVIGFIIWGAVALLAVRRVQVRPVPVPVRRPDGKEK